MATSRFRVCLRSSAGGGLAAAVLLLALLGGCGGGNEKPMLNSKQQAVHAVALAWAENVEREDLDAIWELVSKDWKLVLEQYRRQAWIEVVNLNLALKSPSLPAEERQRIERDLAEKFPSADPETMKRMTAKEYYIWTLAEEINEENKRYTRWHLSHENVREIVIDGAEATLVVRQGEPERVWFVREGEVWKRTVSPAMKRELEKARNGGN